MQVVSIINASWASNLVYATMSVLLISGGEAVGPAAAVVAIALFAVALVVWVWTFAIAASRSSAGDDITISTLFLVEGDAPKSVRVHLYGSLAVCIAITALSASANPFGVLVPMLPLGLIGLWGARNGTFSSRSDVRRVSDG